MTKKSKQSEKCKECSHKRIMSNVEHATEVGDDLLIGKMLQCINQKSRHFGHIIMDYHPACECFELHKKKIKK